MTSEKNIAELWDQDDLITKAIHKGTLEAMKQYIQAGQSMVSWKDGKVVMVPPEELKKILEAEEKS